MTTVTIHKHIPPDGSTLREADCYRVFIDTGKSMCGELVRAKWVVDLGAGSEDDKLRMLLRSLPAGDYWVYHVQKELTRGRSQVTWSP
jgi:hypothetical protein